MNMTCEKGALLKALSRNLAAVEKKSTMPILSHLLIQAQDQTLTLSSTDLDLAVRTTLAASVQTPGKATVPAHLFFEIVKKLPDGAQIQVSFNQGDTMGDGGQSDAHVTVTVGPSVFKLPTLDADTFPPIMTQDLPHQFLIHPGHLLKLLEKTKVSMALDDVNYYMNGLYLHHNQGFLCAAATDGHRLATTQIQAPEGSDQLPPIILSRKCVLEMIHLAQGATDAIKISASDNQIALETAGVFFSARLIDATFPDYRSVIPKHHRHTIYVDMQEFSKVVDRVATVSSEKERCVRVMLSSGTLKVTAVGNKQGFGDDEIAVDYHDEPTDFVFNSRYLIDIAQQFEGPEGEIRLHDSETAAVIQEPLDQDTLYLIMPMRG